MTVWSSRRVKLAVVLAATLLAFAAWQVYAARVAWAGLPSFFPRDFQDFKCYEATPGGKPLNVPVTLTDQFHDGNNDGGPENVTVRATKYLCTPTRKCEVNETVECPPTIFNGPFLKCYNITPAGPPAQATIDVFTPQFGDNEELTVRTAQLLCAFTLSEEE